MGPGRSQFSWDAAALTPPSNFEAISSRFRAILGDFGQFWAVLNDFALVLSAFQLRRVSARGEGQGMGQPAQQVLEYLLVWLGPASIGEIYGIFSLSLTRSAASRRLGSERVGRTLAPGVIRAGP